jgi:acetyl esterase
VTLLEVLFSFPSLSHSIPPSDYLGNLTTIVARELSSSISLSIPIYPVIFFGQLSQSKFDNSYQPILPAAVMDWFSLRYFNSREEMSSRLANPYFGDLTKLPRTHVITAEYDVLRDEGVEYFQTLKSLGVNATHQHYDNTVHGFYGAEYFVTHGKQAVIDTANVIKQHFHLQLSI